jgi:hypothetical protein
MKSDDESVNVNSTEEVTKRGMLLTDALYEILADKEIVSGERVIECIKRLKSEIKANISRPN